MPTTIASMTKDELRPNITQENVLASKDLKELHVVILIMINTVQNKSCRLIQTHLKKAESDLNATHVQHMYKSCTHNFITYNFVFSQGYSPFQHHL